MRSRFHIIVLTIVTLVAIAGCTPAHFRAHPDAFGKTATVKTIVLLEPEIKMFEVSAGGVKEPMDEWSNRASRNVTQAIINHFDGSGVAVKVLKREEEAYAEEIKEILALHNAVCWSIFLHTYNPVTSFPTKKDSFYYSIGAIDPLLQRLGADALLLVQGQDEAATAGRKAVNVLKVLTGVPLAATTVLMATLADRNGDVLWFNFVANGGAADLREPQGTDAFVTSAFDSFPRIRK